jgi:hypothetical protein
MVVTELGKKLMGRTEDHFASNPNDPGNPYGPGIDVLVDSVIVAPLAP